ncbi:ribosomal RNA-processing protein 8 isoform X3 [Anomaloglossus baeobatrachus]|uniref:ribosomal RNA-processing protein 8 isoform X3 n=1 Tax=Anomaloglossus baeobatrachus TaxID=238106 RepID=UPI003F504F11
MPLCKVFSVFSSGDAAMFDTCEWNEECDDQTRSPGTMEQKTSRAQEKVNTSRKKRLKRNRQLLEVLRTLSIPSTLLPDLPTPPDATSPKKRKKTAPGASISEVASRTEPPPESEERLSRQQWRNKIKNKRRNRNKFKVMSVTGGETEGQERFAGGNGEAEASAAQEKNSKNQRSKRDKSRGKHNGVVSGKRGEKETPCLVRSSASKRLQKSQCLTAVDRRTPRDAVATNQPAVHKQQVTPQDRSRLQKLKQIMQRNTPETPGEEDPHVTNRKGEQPEADNRVAARDLSAELRSRMELRLNSARFRYINQQLYESDSHDAVNLFKQDPEAFTIYHSGFSQQVQRWPVNPITEIIKYIKHRPSSLEIADFGCGDALLARSVRNRVHSFDLVALNEHVTVCNMAKVPLLDSSVDIAVFCLSLMGKNLSAFLEEANRVLKPDGVLLVAEVSSRFEDVRQFLNAMSQLGFKSVNKNTENSHFFLFEFNKTGRARDAAKHPGLQLKPCLYKKR